MSLIYKTFTPDMVDQYFDSYITTLDSNIVPAGEQYPQTMKNNLQTIINQGFNIIVALDTEIGIVGTVTVLIEQKLIRGGVKAAHIEDLITKDGQEGKGIGGQLVQEAIKYAKKQGCYKIIADTRDKLVPRFAKFGFDSPERMIRKYLIPTQSNSCNTEKR